MSICWIWVTWCGACSALGPASFFSAREAWDDDHSTWVSSTWWSYNLCPLSFWSWLWWFLFGEWASRWKVSIFLFLCVTLPCKKTNETFWTTEKENESFWCRMTLCFTFRTLLRPFGCKARREATETLCADSRICGGTPETYFFWINRIK